MLRLPVLSIQVTTDPIGLYLYLLKAFSDERHELLEDDRRFTDFVARYSKRNMPEIDC